MALFNGLGSVQLGSPQNTSNQLHPAVQQFAQQANQVVQSAGTQAPSYQNVSQSNNPAYDIPVVGGFLRGLAQGLPDFAAQLGTIGGYASQGQNLQRTQDQALQSQNQLQNLAHQASVRGDRAGAMRLLDQAQGIQTNPYQDMFRSNPLPSQEQVARSAISSVGEVLPFSKPAAALYGMGLPGRLAVNSVSGALINNEDPLQGALYGVLGGEAVHGAGVLASKAARSGFEALPSKPAYAMTSKLPKTPTYLREDLGVAPTPKTPTGPVKTVGIFRKAFDRTRNIIGSQGVGGKKLAGMLEESRNQAEITSGGWQLKLSDVRSLSNKEFENMVDVMEGKAAPISSKVATAAQTARQVEDEVVRLGNESGLDINYLSGHFPHVYKESAFAGDNFYKNVQHLVQTGQAKTEAEASQMLRYAQDLVRNRRQGNLEMPRIADLPGYEKTKEAFFNYLDSAANRIAQAKVLGKGDERALALINQIGQEGYDSTSAKNLFDIAVGAKKYDADSLKLSGALTGAQTVTKLGLGAITNTGQSLNTASVVGVIRTILNAPKAAFSQEAKDFALRAGVTVDGVIKDVRSGSGFGGKIGKIGAPGFNTVEKFNRTLAAYAGRDFAREMASKAAQGDKGAIEALNKLGINGDAIRTSGRTLTEAEEIQAARSIVERTQFKVDPQDLPAWASSPWGRVLSQFRTFSYNQTAFVARELIQPALKGNVLPLTRYLLLAPLVGGTIMEAKNVLRNRPQEEDPTKRIAQYFQQAGGLGIAGDLYTGLFPQNSKYLDANRAVTLALSTLGGPTAGSIVEGYGALTNAVQGKPQNLERFALRQIPVVGPTVSNTLLPYKPGGNELLSQIPGLGDLLKHTPTPEEQKKAVAQRISDAKGRIEADGGVEVVENTLIYDDDGVKTIKLTGLAAQGTGLQSLEQEEKRARVAKRIMLASQAFDPGSSISVQQAKEILTKIGVDPQDAFYSAVDSLSDRSKAKFVNAAISNSKTPDEANGIVKELVTRKILSSTVITEMGKQGLISSEMVTFLKQAISQPTTRKSTVLGPRKASSGVSRAATGRVPTVRSTAGLLRGYATINAATKKLSSQKFTFAKPKATRLATRTSPKLPKVVVPTNTIKDPTAKQTVATFYKSLSGLKNSSARGFSSSPGKPRANVGKGELLRALGSKKNPQLLNV